MRIDMLGGMASELIAVGLFFGGVILVIKSVEIFVEAVAESAATLGVSGFLLTVLLAGIDLENAVLGVAAVVGQLPALALGTVFGEALFILGDAVGLAGLLAPFETTTPRSYLLLFLGSPAVLLNLMVDGQLSRFDGAVLVLAFVPLLAAVIWLEIDADTQYLATEGAEEVLEENDNAELLSDGDHNSNEVVIEKGDDENKHKGWYHFGVAVLAVVGMTVGSKLAIEGTRGLLTTLGIRGFVFGATVLSLIASLEELFLTVTPARQGHAHLSIGNVIGSVLFFVTANAGVITLVHPIDVSDVVLVVHWPFFTSGLILVAGMLYRGQIKRPEGVLLLTFYITYWGVNYMG